MQTRLLRGAAALALSLALGACSDSLSLDAAGTVAMTLQRADSSLAFPAPQSETETRSVSPDTVSSFKVTITSIQCLHAQGDSNAGQWSTVQLRAPITINLMALPSQQDSALVFARGQLEAGSYARVRFTVANPTIRFKGNVGFGLGGMLQGNTDYSVELAGSDPTTIEAAAAFSVSSDSQSSLALVFDQQSTLNTVTFDGSGAVSLAAVIEAR